MSLSDNIICAGQQVTLTNQSSLNPTEIKWLLNPGAYTKDALDKNQIVVSFKDNNIQTVGLIAGKLGQCFDTIYKTIKSIVVKADFICKSAANVCADNRSCTE